MSALQTEHKPACSQPHLEYCNTFFFFLKQVLKLWCFQIKTPIELCSHTPPRALQQLPCSIISFCTGTEPDQVPVPCCRLSLRARERSRISQAYFSLHTEQLSLLLWNRTPIFFYAPFPGTRCAHTQTYDLTYLIGDAPLLSMKRYFVSMTSFVFPVSSNADFISMLTNLQTGKGNRDNEKKPFKPQQCLNKAVKLIGSLMSSRFSVSFKVCFSPQMDSTCTVMDCRWRR